jgi:hypothetical protein
MANEITYQVQAYLRNGTLQDQYASGSKVADQASAFLVRNVQTIGTGAGGAELDLGSVASPGWAIFINLDPVIAVPTGNYLEVGVFSAAFIPFLKLLPSEVAMVRLAAGAAAPYAKATGGSVDIFYIIYNA